MYNKTGIYKINLIIFLEVEKWFSIIKKKMSLSSNRTNVYISIILIFFFLKIFVITLQSFSIMSVSYKIDGFSATKSTLALDILLLREFEFRLKRNPNVVCTITELKVTYPFIEDLSPKIGESVISLRRLLNDTILLDIITVLGFADIFL